MREWVSDLSSSIYNIKKNIHVGDNNVVVDNDNENVYTYHTKFCIFFDPAVTVNFVC